MSRAVIRRSAFRSFRRCRAGAHGLGGSCVSALDVSRRHRPPDPFLLASGAEARVSNPGRRLGVVCVNGGQRQPVEGTWSASLEWLVGRLAPQFPLLSFGEVRYRIKSWELLERCREDARAAIAALEPDRCLLLGFSMGCAVAVGVADVPPVAGVLGLAPWLPDRLDFEPLRGKRLDVLHGSLDRRLPGLLGISPKQSRRGFDRARLGGSCGDYRVIPGALH